MISTINFENHINRFLETMRGVQRILFVGTGICIENYPVLAGEKWKCIYTTNQSDRLADTFSRAERQVRPIYTKHEYDSARTKLDQNNPLLVFINGRASKENDDEDIDQEVERRENSKLLLKSMTSLLKSDLMVELVIVGYNPQDNGELSPYDLYAELRLLSDNRVTFYGVTPEIAANKYIKKLANDGIVTLFAQDLGEALENRCSVADNDSEDSPVVTHDVENANNTVYIDGHPVVLDASLCYDFNKYGRVLSVREMATGTISRMMQTEFFYQFLTETQWTILLQKLCTAADDFFQELSSNMNLLVSCKDVSRKNRIITRWITAISSCYLENPDYLLNAMAGMYQLYLLETGGSFDPSKTLRQQTRYWLRTCCGASGKTWYAFWLDKSGSDAPTSKVYAIIHDWKNQWAQWNCCEPTECEEAPLPGGDLFRILAQDIYTFAKQPYLGYRQF